MPKPTKSRKPSGASDSRNKAPVPISLIVDDGAPANAMYWHQPDYPHVHLVPNTFVRDFADVCDEHDILGKFSVLPIPMNLGRIDRKLCHVPDAHLRGFLQIVRKRIAPRFDITPEILTHLRAYDVATGHATHIFEDHLIRRADVPLMTDYMSLAFEILKNVGLPATGLTSPWDTGRHNEPQYAEALGRAMYRVHRRKFAWYFLHMITTGPGRAPAVTFRDRKTGLTVVHVPANTEDPFWETQYQSSRRAGRAKADAGVEGMLSSDGRSGRLVELLKQGCPLVMITHWQSLFANGHAAGLYGLDRLCTRIRRHLGDRVAWMRCSELARTAI